ncbi:MAG: hypothetical protein V8R26_02855 [Clostridia bacterium]
MDFKFNVYVHSLSDANTQIYEKISKLENVDNFYILLSIKFRH